MLGHFPSLLQPNPISARCAFCLSSDRNALSRARPPRSPASRLAAMSNTTAARLPQQHHAACLPHGDLGGSAKGTPPLHTPTQSSRCNACPAGGTRAAPRPLGQGATRRPHTKREAAALRAALRCSLCANATAAQHCEPRADSWRLQPRCCPPPPPPPPGDAAGKQTPPRSVAGTVYRQNPWKPTLPPVTPPPASNDLFHCSTTGNPLRLKTAHAERLCLLEAMICVFSCTTCPRLCGHHSVCASPAGVTAVPRPATPLHNSQTQTFQFAFPKGAANCDMSSSSQHRCRLQHTTSSHQEASGIISLLLRAGCAGRASGPAPHYRATGSTAAPATSGYPAQGGASLSGALGGKLCGV